MNKSSLWSRITSLFSSSFSIINKNPLIYIFSLLMTLRLSLETALSFPKLLSFVIAFFLIGWMALKLDLIYQAYDQKKITWNQVGNLLVKYFKKILPIIPLLLVIYYSLFALFLITSLFHFNPILGSQQSVLEKKQLIAGEVRDWQMSLIGGFTPFSPISIILSTFYYGVLFFWTQTLVNLVVNQENIFISLRKAQKFFRNNISFFLLLILIMVLISEAQYLLINIEFGGFLVKLVLTAATTYINLIFSGVVLINYLDKSKKI